MGLIEIQGNDISYYLWLLFIGVLGLMSFKNIFASSDKPASLGNKFRNQRFRFFEEKLSNMPKPIRILDIGGLESFWLNRSFENNTDYQITLLNLTKVETSYSNFISIAGNATDLKDIRDKEYDIVFSNSVIEHLYTKENQVKMANEVKRIGRFYFVQTPNKHFPIEPHYVLPFFQYLPNAVKEFILTKTRLSRLKKWDNDSAKQYIKEIRLLSFKEMKALFPGSKFYIEKFAGLTKSFTAHNFPW